MYKYKVTAKCFFGGRLRNDGEFVEVDCSFEEGKEPSYLEPTKETAAKIEKESKTAKAKAAKESKADS